MHFLGIRIWISLIIICPIIVNSFLSSNYRFAQTTSRVSISGKVTDSETGQPLPNVDVYLLGTTLGDIADESGNYIIQGVPFGNHELVASMMGYEVQRREVAIYQSTLRTFHFKLKPKVFLAEEVEVTTEEPKEWKKNLKVLEKVFFGVKDFSKKCKFLNPEYINLEYDEVLKEFKAYAEEPIRFENKALGYEVTFILEEFTMKLGDRSRKGVDRAKFQKYKRTSLVEFYKELIPKNDGEKKKWKKNRLKAYRGSQRHFLKSLCDGRLAKEGFELCGSTTVTFIDDVNFLHRVHPDSLLSKTTDDSRPVLSFPNYLMVIYKKEGDDIGRFFWRDFKGTVRRPGRLAKQKRYQVSWLDIIHGKDVILNKNGFIIPEEADLSLITGYWLWDCPAEWLPYDYHPEK